MGAKSVLDKPPFLNDFPMSAESEAEFKWPISRQYVSVVSSLDGLTENSISKLNQKGAEI